METATRNDITVKTFTVNDQTMSEIMQELINFFEGKELICSYYDEGKNRKEKIIDGNWERLSKLNIYDEYYVWSRESVGVPTLWNIIFSDKVTEVIITPENKNKSDFFVKLKDSYYLYFLEEKFFIKYKEGKESKIVCFEKDK
jgi:hypothetical protein